MTTLEIILVAWIGLDFIATIIVLFCLLRKAMRLIRTLINRAVYNYYYNY